MRTTLAVVVPVVFLAGCASTPLTGAWRSRVQFSSGDFSAVKDLEFMYVFNHGGTMTESSNYDASPPAPPAYGTWRAVGERRYEAVYEFYMTKPPEKQEQLMTGWGPAGRGELTERIQLAPDGNSFESAITLRVFDPAGNPAPGGAEAKGRATRIGFAGK